VTVAASSEHKNRHTCAISSGSAKRPSGIFSACAASASSFDMPLACAACSPSPPGPVHSSVATAPGATALTSTPLPAHRSAHARTGVGLGDVAAQPLGPDLVRRRPQRLLVAGHHEHARALAHQLGAERAPDPAARARDDAHAITQSEVHSAHDVPTMASHT